MKLNALSRILPDVIARRMRAHWHIAAGTLLASAGTWALLSAIWRIIRRINYGPPQDFFDFHPPPPLSFGGYATECLFALVIIAAGLAIFCRRWLVLSLCCWFPLTLIVLEKIYTGFFLGWHGLLPTGSDVILGTPLLAVIATCWTANSQPDRSRQPSGLSMVETVLGSLVVVGLVVRSTVYLLGPEGGAMLGYLRGHGMESGGDVVSAANCIIGPVLALVLAGTMVAARAGRDTPFLTTLTFVSVMTLGSAWTVLDTALVLANQNPTEPTSRYAALIFVVAATALALALRRLRQMRPERSV